GRRLDDEVPVLLAEDVEKGGAVSGKLSLEAGLGQVCLLDESEGLEDVALGAGANAVSLALVPAGGGEELLRLGNVEGGVLLDVLWVDLVGLETCWHEAGRDFTRALVAALQELLAVREMPDGFPDSLVLLPGQRLVRPEVE